MNDKFNEQKDTLLSIKKEISLLHQQVDFLLRNEKPLELLDLDVLMNRTHTLYDLLCSIDLGLAPDETAFANDESAFANDADSSCSAEEEKEREKKDGEMKAGEKKVEEMKEEEQEQEELPIDPAILRAMFGIEDPSPEEASRREALSVAPESPSSEDASHREALSVETPSPTSENASHRDALSVTPDPIDDFEENEDAYFEEEVEDDPVDVPAETPVENTPSESPSPENASHTDALSEPSIEERVARDDFGFILNFEPIDTPVETPIETSVETPINTPAEILPEPPAETPSEPTVPLEPASHRDALSVTPETPSVFTTGDEIEMTIPHVETPENDYEIETLGDKLQHEHNPTVADKLQHGAVSSLRSSIGINDKFLFVNELFNGSMEKYNRSIENLDDLKTLNGALIYLNELRVELQWNSSNEAYKKILELIHRKFES